MSRNTKDEQQTHRKGQHKNKHGLRNMDNEKWEWIRFHPTHTLHFVEREIFYQKPIMFTYERCASCYMIITLQQQQHNVHIERMQVNFESQIK